MKSAAVANLQRDAGRKYTCPVLLPSFLLHFSFYASLFPSSFELPFFSHFLSLFFTSALICFTFFRYISCPLLPSSLFLFIRFYFLFSFFLSFCFKNQRFARRKRSNPRKAYVHRVSTRKMYQGVWSEYMTDIGCTGIRKAEEF